MIETLDTQPTPRRIIAASEVLVAMGIKPYHPIVPPPPIVDPNAPTYSVVTASSPPHGGVGVGDGTYLQGATVTLVALPQQNYVFVNWTYTNGLEASRDGTYTFVVTANTNLIANFVFAPIEYPVGVPWNVYRQMLGHLVAANASREVVDTYSKAQSPVVTKTPAASDAKLVGRENQDEPPPPPPHV